MKNFHKNSWIDDKDLSGDISFIESSSNELQPIAVESILEDESAGLIAMVFCKNLPRVEFENFPFSTN